jgi:ATP-dependent protease ClpP protease subunit
MNSTFIFTGEITPASANQFLYVAAENIITDVVISSPGGDIGLTLGLFDVIKFQGINTHVVGLAQSAAAVLLQAGKRRTMTNSSLLMFHAPEENCTDAEFRLYTQLVEMVVQRTGLNIAEGHDLFDNKFINANRALELNLIDEITTDDPKDPKDSDLIRWTKYGRTNRNEKATQDVQQKSIHSYLDPNDHFPVGIIGGNTGSDRAIG